MLPISPNCTRGSSLAVYFCFQSSEFEQFEMLFFILSLRDVNYLNFFGKKVNFFTTSHFFVGGIIICNLNGIYILTQSDIPVTILATKMKKKTFDALSCMFQNDSDFFIYFFEKAIVVSLHWNVGLGHKIESKMITKKWKTEKKIHVLVRRLLVESKFVPWLLLVNVNCYVPSAMITYNNIWGKGPG
jgi:hypothetical protein